ncbi:MAG: hypothetical protein EA408_11520 [Marinilabiliales bacterium]|nr:MAG: hypothetical protein EA408_11520 [Marinilabiliales bacterium]
MVSIFPGVFIILAFTGFFRSSVTGIRPEFILDQKKIQEDWATRSSFTTLLMPLMGLLVFVFNAIAWAVYGLISVFEFLAFLFRAVWWVITWIWNEVIHPVLFFLVKLAWHYIVIWGWRFFKIAFNRIPDAFSAETYKKGFISVLAISFVVLLFYYLSNILEQEWILIVMLFAFTLSVIWFSGFTLYDDSDRPFDEYWTGTMTVNVAITIFITLMSAVIILLLHLFAGTSVQLPVLGIAFGVTQLLIMVFILTLITFMAVNTVIPAYMASGSGIFETKEFLINTGIRLPRILGVIPFVLLGGFITSILTILLGAFLWWSTGTVKESFCNNATENMRTELADVRSDFREFYDTVAQVSLARDYPESQIRRIAVLESRIFSLEQFNRSWIEIMADLPSGIRSTSPIRENISKSDNLFFNQYESILKEIEVAERTLEELLDEQRISPGNAIAEQRVDLARTHLNSLFRDLHQAESKFVLDTRFSEEVIRSIRATNIMWVTGTFLAMIGLVLLMAIMFTPYWIYRTKLYFDLYSYHHEGKSYLAEQLDFYRNRNPNQPLLGFFVVFVFLLIVQAFLMTGLL